MRIVLLAASATLALHAAGIRGVVVEDATGHPVARALVVAQPIAGTSAATRSARSNRNGQFDLAALPQGAYLVLASRRGFAPVQYGQKQWKGSGVPVAVEESGDTSIEIRLQRYGSIAGAVLDENDVGLPDHDVVAYRDSRPPVLAARATSDDRGRYRLWGLDPGSYLVRTVGKEYDQGGYLPTFARQTMRVDEAMPTEVALDRETDHVDIRPFPGRLFTITGRTVPLAAVTLLSDVGAQTVSADARGNFRFPPVAPGPYELSARSIASRAPRQSLAAWQAINVDRDRADYRLSLAPLPVLSVRLEDPQGQPLDPQRVQLLLRRRDLSGAAPSQTFRPPAALPPGRYEIALAPSPDYYATGFDGHAPAAGWNQVELASTTEVRIVLSPHPARLHGAVEDRGKPVAGVPVYLEADGLEPRMTRTDTAGHYEFYGLAPGRYRVWASFATGADARASVVELSERQDQDAGLALGTPR